MTKPLRIGAALICVAVATLLVLFAVDVHAWSSRLPADDLRFKRDAMATKLWQPHEILPFSHRILAIDDDLAYRRALREFRLGRTTEPVSTRAIGAHRIAAQIALTDVVDANHSARIRSQVDNLLGVLAFGLGSQDIAERRAFFNNAITAFRNAVVFDPTNDDAFFNLEYALDQVRGQNDIQTRGSSESRQHGTGGLKSTGHGY
jgi:hypothetical protein